MDKRLGRSENKGFTLVELLVVIAIIALLISMLLPSLAKAREQAKKMKCLGNLKDTAAASYTYALEDPNEEIVPRWSSNNWVGHGENSQAQWMGPFSEYNWGGKGGDPSAWDGPVDQRRYYTQWNWPKTPNGPGDRLLNKVLYTSIQNSDPGSASEDDILRAIVKDNSMDLRAYHCPSDRGVSDALDGRGLIDNFGAENIVIPGPSAILDQTKSLYDAIGNSYKAYFLNTFFGSTPDGLPPGVGYSYSAAQRPYSQIGTPSRVVLYAEGNAQWTHIWNHQGGWGPLGVDTWAGGWHGEKMVFNCSFVDGHAGTMDQNVRMQAPTGIDDSAKGFEYTGEWVIAGCRPEFVFMPHSNAYTLWTLLYRGEGWQLDTFPSPVLPLSWE